MRWNCYEKNYHKHRWKKTWSQNLKKNGYYTPQTFTVWFPRSTTENICTLIKSALQFSVTNNKFWKINKEYTKINVYTICSHYSFGALEQVNWLFKNIFVTRKHFNFDLCYPILSHLIISVLITEYLQIV